jgi:hypothetical protein
VTTTIATIGERALRRLGVAVIPLADRPALNTTVDNATLATLALVELGVIASDETPSTTDQALAVDKIASVHASLAAQALVWWPVEAVPLAVKEEYTKLAALFMASSFGKQVDPQLVAMLETRVRRISVVLSAPDIATDAAQGVHNDFVMRGKARWTSQDIPDAVADAYMWVTANAIAREFDKPANPADDKAAEIAIARYIALPTSGEPVAVDYF